jgi:phenylpropionate dioxygenase-like ring-hydroxylating dioxygenase large terminal subunit
MVMQFEKPEAGSWTKAYPDLGTGLISYEDSISPEFYELEREAIFRRTWLNIGRVEQVPNKGSYFTKELAVCDTSIVVVRGQDDKVRAFHNMCRHRGNKLVWQDYPTEEVSGTCRQFTCKYHGWRYALDGELTFIQQEQEFFDLDKSDFPLVEINLDVWEGFIFINLDREPAETLQEFLGELSGSFEGYPFSELTQVFSYSAEVGSNWKLFIDAFQEFYHAPVLHNKQSPAAVAVPMMEAGFEAIHYSIHGDHRVVSTGGSRMDTAEVSPEFVKPIDILFRSGLFGPWDRAENERGLLSPGMNPSQHPAWGLDSFQFFPNFVILVWEPGWYLTYHYWPTAVNSHIFEGRLYFRPPKNASERLAQELAAVTFKEFALQDGNTLEATQTMLQSRVITEFPLCDQEVLCRHLHKVAHDYVDAYGGVGKDKS